MPCAQLVPIHVFTLEMCTLSLPICSARAYSAERFQIENDLLFLEDADGILAVHSLQNLSNHISASVPPIPPKTWKKELPKSHSTSALHSRSLCRGYNNFTFPEERPATEQKGHIDSTLPPPIPVRSKSKEHFYHTLEYNGTTDSGLVLSSPNFSSPRDSNSSQNPDFQKEEDSEHVHELFDDPRYVAVVVEDDMDVEGRGLQGRKEIWRSTPALASTQPAGRGSTNRRSLRQTQVVGGAIYN